MAIDGVNIIDSDLANDIRNEILDLYDKQKSEQEIKSYLQSMLLNLEESLSMEIFLTTSCFVLWEIGMPDSYLLEQLEITVNNGADIFWLNNFDENVYKKRTAELGRLLMKVREPNKKRRRRKKYIEQVNTLFSKGDIIAIKVENHYRCMIFEDFYQHKNDAYYSFVVTTYNGDIAPIPDNILLEEIPVTKTKTGELGVRKLSIDYKFVEQYQSALRKSGTACLDSKTENLGFSRQVNGIEDLISLEDEMEDILLGEKVGFYHCYSYS